MTARGVSLGTLLVLRIRLKLAVWRSRLRSSLLVRIVRKWLLLQAIKVSAWSAERLAGPEVRARMREMEQQEPPR